MDFSEKIKQLSEKITNLKEDKLNEEATKHSFVMPFIQALGYDVFDPNVVKPEFTADIGKKKNEKIDYAIMQNDIPLILIEAKACSENLDNHATQLERYYTVTDSKFAILTNGVEYRFYSDIDKVNRMDSKPFLIVNMLNIKDRDIKKLSEFCESQLDVEKVLNMANSQKYILAIKNLFKEETKNPGDEIAKYFASQITDKLKTQKLLDEFKGYIKTAFNDIVNDMAKDQLDKISVQISDEEPEDDNDGIVTTEQEMEGYFIVKSILAEKADVKRVTARDTKSYFGVLLDDNNRKWICRLRFNTSQKYLGLHIRDKEEEKIPLERVEDIYTYRDMLLKILARLEG